MLTRSLRMMAGILLVALLAACAAPAAAPAGQGAAGQAAATQSTTTAAGAAAAPAAGENVTLNLWFNSDNLFNTYNEKVIAAFEAANPGVKIVYSPYPNEAFKTNLQVAIGSDAPPDIFFNWAGDDTARFAREGNLLDLTKYATEYKWADSLSPAMVSAFTVNDKVYGVPYTQEAKYFYYHKDVFDKLGLKPPANFDELLALCGKISESGMTPLAFGNQERWEGVHYLTIFNQKVVGEKTIAEDYSLKAPADKLFTDPGYVEAFNRLKKMQDAKCFGDAVNSTTPDAARVQFENQQTAMYYQGTWIIGNLKESGLEGKYGMFRMPPMTDSAVKGNQNFVLAGPTGLEISSKTKYPDIAAKFVDFYVSQANQKALLEDLNRIPVRADAVDRAKAPAAVVSVVDDLAKGEGTALWLDVVLENSISEAYLNSIQEVLGGTKTPEDAVKAVRDQALKVQAGQKK